MKKEIRKILALVFSGALCLSLLAGCGEAAAPENYTRSEPAPEEEVFEEEPEGEEFYEEEPEDLGELEGDEEFEMEYGEEANEPAADTGAAEGDAEPAEGLSDQVLMKGYYGFWNGETKYMFGVLSDTEFMINVVGASSPILYAEGTYKDNGDGTFTASITESDNDFAQGQTIDIKALGGPDISLSSTNAEVNKAVEGTYTHAGEKASDVDSLK